MIVHYVIILCVVALAGFSPFLLSGKWHSANPVTSAVRLAILWVGRTMVWKRWAFSIAVTVLMVSSLLARYVHW